MKEQTVRNQLPRSLGANHITDEVYTANAENTAHRIKAEGSVETAEKAAFAYFSKDGKLYADMSECVLKGAAEFVFAGEDGVLLYERDSGIYMLAAETKDAAKRILSRLSLEKLRMRSGLLVAHGDEARAAALEISPEMGETPCYQVVYTSGKPKKLTGILDIRVCERAQLEIIKKEYFRESSENLEKLFSAGKIFCGFKKSPISSDNALSSVTSISSDNENSVYAFPQGEFVGFIGSHPEGSMGLLQVFPPYRRQGFAEELESFMINRFLMQKRVPYAHIVEDNLSSMKLQLKLGYEVADKKVYWLFENGSD